jgi:hypothetical protein
MRTSLKKRERRRIDLTLFVRSRVMGLLAHREERWEEEVSSSPDGLDITRTFRVVLQLLP